MDYKLIEQQLDELNLDGYKSIKNNEWGDIPDKLMEYLISHDFEMIGDGVFSYVFKSPTENFVVKVNNGVGIMDTDYISFVKFCNENKNNPHLPKTGKLKRIGRFYVVFIEELKPFNLETISNSTMDWQDLKNIFTETISYFIDTNDRNKRVKYFYKILDQFNVDILKADAFVPQIYDICVIMTKFVDEYNITKNQLDLHNDNIMLRGKTLVVTDPVAN